MNRRFPTTLKSQLLSAARANDRTPREELRARLEQSFLLDAVRPYAFLSRLIMEVRNLDMLIPQLCRERHALPAHRPLPHWQPPHWLEASLPPALVGAEYEVLIDMLSARRADLGRIYRPLMNSITTGSPVPGAVLAVLGV